MSDEEITSLESALKSKDENTITEITMNHTTEERLELREKYNSKFNRELLDDIEKYTKSDLCTLLTSVYKDPIEYDVELLYKAMKGIGTNLKKIKQKFKEKYNKDLISEIKSETSGDYSTTLISLIETERSNNSQPDIENCKKIAEELYESGEGKIGTNENTFVKYFTTLSADEISIVGKEYHKKYKKNIVQVIENEIDGDLKKLFKCILYGLISPSEYFARQINGAIKGIGTDNTVLIRSIVTRMDIDMIMIKKYYRKLFGKRMAEDIKGDTSGNYQKLLLKLIGEK